MDKPKTAWDNPESDPIQDIRDFFRKALKEPVYRVEIWCEDCTNVDPMGCFDGSSEYLQEEFDDLEKAKEAGWNKTRDCSPWQFNVWDSEILVYCSSTY